MGQESADQSYPATDSADTGLERPDMNQTPLSEEAAKPASVCGVCGTNPPKYKCPRCYMPYCSVACNKIHRENHPPDPEPQHGVQAKPEPEFEAESKLPTQTAFDPANPFQALAESSKLKMLFSKYPSLPEQLRQIHEATLPPKPAPTDKLGIPASLMKGAGNKDTWNHDIGIQNGKAALRRAKRADGQDGEAIREYYELTLHIMNEQSSQHDTTRVVHDQVSQEDAKLIERLMAQENR